MENEKLYSGEQLKRMDIWGGLEAGTSEKVMEDYEKKRTEPLSGAETAKVAAEVYEILGAEFGCRFVEPNAVLLMAGMKGFADLPWIRLNKETAKKLHEANLHLEKSGIVIIFPRSDKKESEITSMGAIGFRGIERKSRMTKIPGVPTFDSKLGSEGRADWGRSIYGLLKESQKSGKISQEINLQILLEGIYMGYPDQAILDFEKCYREGDIHKELESADILSVAGEARKYHGAIPEFDYYPEHIDDPEIVEYIRKARQILKDFYSSEWFKNIEKSNEFIRSRKLHDETFEEGIRIRDEKHRNASDSQS